MAAYGGVREAVVLAREDVPGDKRLVAYYTVTEGTEVNAAGPRAPPPRPLASYMVPAAYVQLESLPLTPNGKLDRKALPAPEGAAYARGQYEAPVGEIEQGLAGIWSEVLRVERIGRHDNFFELGGHSLLAMRALERMRALGLAVDVRTLFQKPTVAELAGLSGQQSTLVEAPANLITEGCERITPQMLPLGELSQEEIERVVAKVPGGVRNVQDIYALAPLQEGILFHHRMGRRSDPYVLSALLRFGDRAKLAAYVEALNAVIARHDILRTSVLWEGLSKPVQVVWRQAKLLVEEVRLPATGDVLRQLKERCHPRHHRFDITQAPMMCLYVAHDPQQDRWVGVLLYHHLVLDHATMEVMNAEVRLYLAGRMQQWSEALPYRRFVAHVRQALERGEYQAFFQRMLEEAEEPTAPFGLVDVHRDGSEVAEMSRRLEPQLSSRVRQCAKVHGVSAASLFHVAWGQLLARASGQDDPVFGTVVFGRMYGSEGVERVMGPFINTLPVRVRLSGTSVQQCVRETHELLGQLLLHEHAPLAEVQRGSRVPAGVPLFTALLNYRHNVAMRQLVGVSEGSNDGVEYLEAHGRSNFPLMLSVDDWGEGFGLSVQVIAEVGVERVCAMMLVTLEQVVTALESEPTRPVRQLEVLPQEERHQLLVQWNQTARPYPRNRCMHELFEEQVLREPGAIAVVCEGQSLTYGQLTARANRLAR